MSKMEGIERTIELLNGMLAEKELSLKDRLAIADRLLRAQSLKLKHADEGHGSKFDPPAAAGLEKGHVNGD